MAVFDATSANELLAIVRELKTSEHTWSTWRAMCSALDKMPRNDLVVALDYAAEWLQQAPQFVKGRWRHRRNRRAARAPFVWAAGRGVLGLIDKQANLSNWAPLHAVLTRPQAFRTALQSVLEECERYRPRRTTLLPQPAAALATDVLYQMAKKRHDKGVGTLKFRLDVGAISIGSRAPVITGVGTRWANEMAAARSHAITVCDGYVEVDWLKARRRKKPDRGGLIYATVTADNEKNVSFAPSRDFGAVTKKGRIRFRAWRYSSHRRIELHHREAESAIAIVDEIVQRVYQADWSGIDRYEWSRAQAAAYVALHVRDDDFDALTTLFASVIDGLDIDETREEYVIESLVDFAQGAFLDKPMPVVIARRLAQLEAQVVEVQA